MKNFILVTTVILGVILSNRVNAYECESADGQRLTIDVLLQGRMLEWSYGLLTGETFDSGGLGVPLGHWKNPATASAGFYSLYTLTRKGNAPYLLLGVQYQRPMQIADVVLLLNSNNVLEPLNSFVCQNGRP